jgi:hypothetical protein
LAPHFAPSAAQAGDSTAIAAANKNIAPQSMEGLRATEQCGDCGTAQPGAQSGRAILKLTMIM